MCSEKLKISETEAQEETLHQRVRRIIESATAQRSTT
jgi:hypothetical protein